MNTLISALLENCNKQRTFVVVKQKNIILRQPYLCPCANVGSLFLINLTFEWKKENEFIRQLNNKYTMHQQQINIIRFSFAEISKTSGVF